MELMLAAFIKPFLLVAVVFLLFCVRWACIKWLPNGRIKSILLRRV